jgi:ABC-type oligopeptide transport system ATPase subunit
VAEFEHLCQPVPKESSAQAVARLEAALALYRGEFLPDQRYGEWTLPHREHLARLYREICLELADHYCDRHDFPAAIRLLTPLLADDPADEVVHRQLMHVYVRAGRRHDALRQYQDCVDALAAEFDVPPGPETTALHDQILNNSSPAQPEPAEVAAASPPAPVNLDARAGLFAGRQSELDVLASILHSARQGQGSTILIAGESGIGKTHLGMEALRLAAESGMAVLLGATHEQEGDLPFQPFVEAFDHFLAEQERSLDENPLAHFHRHQRSLDPSPEHWGLFKVTVNFLLDIAADAPLAFLVDDLHAADETSLQLFHYLARQTRSASVALIATYRTDEPTSTQFDTLVSALYRSGLSQSITLRALSRTAIREILEDALEGQISDALCQTIEHVTAGNPFLIQEIAQALVGSDKVYKRDGFWSLDPDETLDVPDNLSALLRQRVSRLGHNTEEILTAAAVVGNEFRFRMLRRAVPYSDKEILDALDAAMTALLIEETPAGYRFRHPLIRRTLYEDLSRARRADLNTRAAEAIETVYPVQPNDLSQRI